MGCVAVLVSAASCSSSGDTVAENEPAAMPCADDPTVPVTYLAPTDQPTGLDDGTAHRALEVLSSSPEYGPCFRSGRATIADLTPWSSGTGKGPIGVVATVTFTDPVDLPPTLKTWRGVGESEQLPEDDLGRPIVVPVSDASRSQVRVLMVFVTLVGEPGTWAFSKLA